MKKINKMKTLFKGLVLVSLLLIIGQTTIAQQLKAEDEMVNYFKERLEGAPYENHLIPFHEHKKLRKSKLQNTIRAVWEIWKQEVNQHAHLPKPEIVSKNNPPTEHHWDLIKEKPLPFYYVKKVGEKSPEKFPLYLNLHGSGPREREFQAALYWGLKYADTPSIYFIPQIPTIKRYRWWYVPEQQAWEKLFRLAMANKEIDPNRIYVLGISEGGYGSQRLGAYYADYLAGAGPMAGGEPLRNAPPLNFRNIAFSLQTGENDRGFGRNKLTKKAMLAFDSLAKANPGEFTHNIVLQPNKGHHIDYTKTTPWLSQFKRNPYPEHISWVLFPMHGRYRKGFYNVAIIEPLAIKEGNKLDRAVFDIRYDKTKNTVTIQAHLSNPEMTASKEIKQGKIALFLNQHFVDLSEKVKVIYNGTEVYHAKPRLRLENIVESCAFYGDPFRLFPAKVEVNL